MKQYFTKYICDKDFVEDYWETETENKLKQSVTIHIPIYYWILKAYLSIIHNDSIEMWNTSTLNKQTKLYLPFKVKKTKISICPLLNMQFFTEIAFQ